MCCVDVMCVCMYVYVCVCVYVWMDGWMDMLTSTSISLFPRSSLFSFFNLAIVLEKQGGGGGGRGRGREGGGGNERSR